MTVTERIDAMLKEQGISRRKFAMKAHIPPSSFQSAMERGTISSTDMLFSIADALNVSVLDLLGDGSTAAYIEGFNKALENDRIRQAQSEEEYEDATDAVSDLLWFFGKLDVYNQERGVACLRALAGYPFIEGQEAQPEERIITALLTLNDNGKKKAVERVNELTEIPRYRSSNATTSSTLDKTQNKK